MLKAYREGFILHKRKMAQIASPVTAFLSLFIFLTLAHEIQGARILLIAAPAKSHVHYIATVGNDLLRKGHEVHTVLPPEMKNFPGFFDSAVNIHFYTMEQEEMSTDDPKAYSFSKHLFYYTIKYHISTRILISLASLFMTPFCNNLLGDKVLNAKLEELNFDLALMDGFPLFRCSYVLPYRLDIPYVSLVTQYEPWLYGIPALPSVVPLALALDYTEEMTFLQRVYNFLMYVDWHTMPLVYVMSGSYTSSYAPEKPYKSPNQLAAESKLWFLNTDIATDYARPLLPHVIEVGGLTTTEPKPLPEDLQKFMDESVEGVILISFGSLATDLPDFIGDAVSGAIKQFKMKVIYKCRSCSNPDPSNVKIMSWIPQNSILAHPNAKLFITHGGNNGQFEALFNSVPMLVIPLFSDQWYNAKRIQYKGYGIAMDTASVTAEEIVQAAEKINGDVSYKRNIVLGSKIFRSRSESPRDRVVRWIEHILEHGGDYLMSEAVFMPWYQYWMVDILLFLVMIIILFTVLLVFVVKCCIARCFGRKSRRVKVD